MLAFGVSFASASVAGRFLALLEQLVAEHGSASAVARELGLSPSYVAKLRRGEGGGNVREQTVRDVLARLSLPADCLEDDSFDPSRWADFRRRVRVPIGTSTGRVAARAAALEERYEAGDPPDPKDIRQLADLFLGHLGGLEIELAMRVATGDDDLARQWGRTLARALQKYRLPPPDG